MQDFTRKYVLSFSVIIFIMLRTVKGSTQNELNRALKEMGLDKGDNVTQQAFSAARQKIKWEAFLELSRTSVTGSYNEEIKKWRGYRVSALDGSILTLYSDVALLEYFGGLGQECKSAAARGSLLYDITNDIIADSKIAPIKQGERSLAEEHLVNLTGMPSFNNGHKELVILDRGYPSFKLIKSFNDKGISYLMRVPNGFIGKKDLDTLKGANDGWVTLGKSGIRTRVLHITLSTGEIEILITNISEEEIEYEAFSELYWMRWGVETKYKVLKQKLETENFSGRLVDNVKQDFYAMITVMNMISSLTRQADENVKEERKDSDNLYEYKVNINHAIGVYKDEIIKVLIEEDAATRLNLLEKLISRMERRVIPIRPNREVHRKKTTRKARFHHNHKSNC